MVWAVFQDHRGVLHCERVNEGIQCWTKVIPVRPEIRSFLGRVIQKGRQEETLLHTVFLEKFYDRKDYTDNAFEPAGEGYALDPMMRYMKTNKWGPVKIMAFIKCDTTGQILHSKFKAFEPFSESQGPRPGNDRLVAMVHQLSEI